MWQVMQPPKKDEPPQRMRKKPTNPVDSAEELLEKHPKLQAAAWISLLLSIISLMTSPLCGGLGFLLMLVFLAVFYTIIIYLKM